MLSLKPRNQLAVGLSLFLLIKYFPAMFGAMALYVGLAALVHSVLTLRKTHAADAQRSFSSGIHQ